MIPKNYPRIKHIHLLPVSVVLLQIYTSASSWTRTLLRIMNLMIYAGGMRLPVIVIIGNFRVMLVVPTVITMIII